ncbi:unnamed protein product [Calicophoron daubneyi]|uniref:RRM domain-containing protein n=1 Tax=Calicophoron daubneyi TaxID=300641 RepID=A0AAV2T1E3_CALDB
MVCFCAKLKGLHQGVKIKEVKVYFSPIRVSDVKFMKNGVAFVYFRNEKDLKSALQKTGEIHGRQIKILPFAEGTKNTRIEEVADEKPAKNWPVRSRDELKSAILETGRLFIRNLSFNCTEADLESLFSPFGSLSDLHLSYDFKQSASRGFAFVTFLFPNDAVQAFEKLDKTKFMGRLLHILPADELPEKNKDKTSDFEENKEQQQGRHAKSDFQSARFQELKAAASTGHNWNALFIRPDAVATYLAAKFGLNKEQVLNSSGKGSVAVRLAHGEAQLVAELREFLQKNGVQLESFEQGDSSAVSDSTAVKKDGRRDRLEARSSSTFRQLSGTAFLIKNLPVGTTEAEVRDLLKQHTRGMRQENSERKSRFYPTRVIVPPLGITAIVEYPLSQQARLVYRSLAYEPFKDSILYVQWLPNGALKPQQKNSKREDVKMKQENAEQEFELITSLPTDHREERMSTEDSKSRKRAGDDESEFDSKPKKPKQRNYQSKKERLKQQQKQAADEDVSVEANETTGAPDSTKENQSDGEATNNAKTDESEKPAPTKPVLLVRNVPFQATLKELTELFQPIGGLLKVRMPKKPSGGHRGFTFLEFTNIDQAKAALETLGTHTHFLGRRLRIEYAHV